jgi:hypothetical protein
MEKKEYILPENAEQLLTPGNIYKLGYDDFNKGEFLYKHKKTIVADSSVYSFHQGDVLCFGEFKYKEDKEWQDIGDEPNDYLMYEFQGYMCRGSGAERVYKITGSNTGDFYSPEDFYHQED